MSAKDELLKLKLSLGLVRAESMDLDERKETQALEKANMPVPYSYYCNLDGYFKIHDDKYSDEEKDLVLRMKQAKDIKVIKNCVLFFTITSIVGAVIWVVAVLAGARW